MKVTELPSAAIIAALDRMVTTVQEEEDPVALKAYRALFKKHVPFNLRGYVTAHMVKELARAGARPDRNADARRRLRRAAAPSAEPDEAASAASEPRRARSAEPRRRPRREAAPAAEAAGTGGEPRRGRTAEPRRRPRREPEPAAEAASAGGEPRRRPRRDTEPAAPGQRRLFVSIGRNRRVLPDDLAELISDSVAVERSELGEIRILDSYSFVEVPEAVAEDAIAALSGTSFKGRRITVDFARTKT